MHLEYALPQRLPCLVLPQVLGHKHAEMADSIQRPQQHGHDEWDAFLPRRTRLNAARRRRYVGAVFGDTPAWCAVEQYVNDVLFVSREFLGRRPGLVLRRNPLLEVDDDTPAEVKLLVVHLDKTAWLEER